jgi:NAD(P)-dependent dehydrogenase (short-subunit alcohol dehydrogenase family)
MTQEPQKVALVTGAADRIGRAIVLALAQDGWDIAMQYDLAQHGNPAAAMQATIAAVQALGRCAVALACNLADDAQLKTLLARATAALCSAADSRISCLVNLAAVHQPDSAESFTFNRLDAHMHTNLAAPIMLAQALHDATPAGAQSVVINLLDQKVFNLNPDSLSYTLSKAALHSATTILAQALAPKVRVVGIAPHITLQSGLQTAHDTTHPDNTSLDDIAATACFLAASPAITGTSLLVDGGRHFTPPQRDVVLIAP